MTVGSTEQKRGVTVNDFTKAVAYRIYTPAGQFREFKVTVRNHSYSGLPLLVLSTEGAAPVSSKETWIQGTMRIDRQENDCDEFS